MTELTFTEFVDLLDEITDNPSRIPPEDEMEEIVVNVAKEWDPGTFDLKCVLLSLMLHQAALQACINVMAGERYIEDIFGPSIH